jgi:hypothetical protein
MGLTILGGPAVVLMQLLLLLLPWLGCCCCDAAVRIFMLCPCCCGATVVAVVVTQLLLLWLSWCCYSLHGTACLEARATKLWGMLFKPGELGKLGSKKVLAISVLTSFLRTVASIDCSLCYVSLLTDLSV